MRRPTLRSIWFQLHWLVGITAGTLLMLIGLTGALLAFRDELLDAFNPGVRSVAVRHVPVLDPDALINAARAAYPHERIAGIAVSATPGAAARVTFAPASGQRRGETVYVDPYSGAMLPPLRGDAGFEWIESLHRWLLLPREPGRAVLGTLALCLAGLALTGLYLRWPRRLADWRAWFVVNRKLEGRSFLWNLHAVAGTFALPLYLVFALTGAYWSFDIVRDTVDGWADTRRAPRMVAPERAGKAKRMQIAARPLPRLAPSWDAFVRRAPTWSTASLRLPEKPGQPVQVTWLASDAPHVRARNRMTLGLDGSIVKDEPYGALSAAQRAVTTIYPLHMGSYFGMPGRIVMMLAALALPAFGITGWMLYLGRRRAARAVARERALLDAIDAPAGAGGSPTLLAFATQSGQAERIALHTAAALRRAGMTVQVQPLAELALAELGRYDTALFVASSYGEGEPPDAARRFSQQLHAATNTSLPLPNLRYAVLGLGDRNYASFCGFGHALDRRLHALGARPLFPIIEVDQGDGAALARWARAIDAGDPGGEGGWTLPDAPFPAWRLAARTELNRGSLGAPLFEITLEPTADVAWRAGDLVEILPCHAPAVVAAYLAGSGLRGDAAVAWHGEKCTLAEVLASSELPNAGHRFGSDQECADALKALVPRRYSIASIAADGVVQLLVRQQRHEQGLGLASGWLTEHVPIGGTVRARLAANPGFHGPAEDVPCIYIGNGSGMAGLRGHLRERAHAGRGRNWLLFGERQRAFDCLCADEIAAWQAAGMLAELDLVFSRDSGEAAYVQDRLRARANQLRAWVAQGAVIHVCGSLQGMAGGVDAALGEILGADGRDALMAQGRYRRDVY
ncbi:PepSY domain-containing protein [Massilia sp. TN1-12]|uniref:PepSY domain-containing protein n=1 Tax=Massilia paldalensis TaxID=3377675 RepID=UPI00384EDDC8